MKNRLFLMIKMVICITLLSACSGGELHLKSLFEDFEEDFIDEIVTYVDLKPEQKLQLDSAAKDASKWMKSERLPVFRGILEQAKEQVITFRTIEETTINEFIDFMENPFPFMKSDEVAEKMAEIGYSLDQGQVIQIKKQLGKETEELSNELKDLSSKNMSKELALGIRYIFSDLGIELTRTDREFLKNSFKTWHDFSEQVVEVHKEWNQRFIELLNNRSISRTEFAEQFVEMWLQSDGFSAGLDTDAWQHNRSLLINAISHITTNLTGEQRLEMVSRLQDYINVILDYEK